MHGAPFVVFLVSMRFAGFTSRWMIPKRVRLRQRFARLQDVRHGVPDAEPAPSLEERGKVFALHVLHDEEGGALVHAHVDETPGVLGRVPGRDGGLAPEAALRFTLAPAQHELHRERGLEIHLRRPGNDFHRPAPQDGVDPVLAGDHGADLDRELALHAGFLVHAGASYHPGRPGAHDLMGPRSLLASA